MFQKTGPFLSHNPYDFVSMDLCPPISKYTSFFHRVFLTFPLDCLTQEIKKTFNYLIHMKLFLWWIENRKKKKEKDR